MRMTFDYACQTAAMSKSKSEKVWKPLVMVPPKLFKNIFSLEEKQQ